MQRCLLITGALLVLAAHAHANGEDLEVNPDFRSVTLQWGGAPEVEAARRIEAVEGAGKVVVSYCELQAWGPYRCREKSIKANRAGRMFSAHLSGLRMATKYTFRINPDPEEAKTTHDVIPLPADSVTAQTKGFSARATLCLANSTEVEVDTGPYFGGRISIEALDGQPGEISAASEDESSSCSVWGNPHSPQSTYKLRFDHVLCGGTKALNASAVATFLLVQESLPILTHSTRRFLVLCTAQPDTLTVTAGISLPGGVKANAQNDNNVGTGEVEPQGARGARLLRNPAIPPALLRHPSSLQAQVQMPYQARLSGSTGAQLVLMLALVSTVAIGSGFAAWWAVRRHRQYTAASAIARRNLDACSATAVSVSRSTSFTNTDFDDLSISSYDQFATRRSINSEVSEASSVLRGDTTSCSSLVTDSSSGSGSQLYGSTHAGPALPIYSIVIKNHDDHSSDA